MANTLPSPAANEPLVPGEYFKYTGAKIAQVRKLLGLNAVQFSERASIDNSLIGKYEKGERIPSIGDLIRLSRATGLPIKVWVDDDESLIPALQLENLISN